MDDDEEKDTSKVKTQVVFHKFTPNELTVLRFMSKISKNVYNISIFCFEVFHTYKDKIFSEVYSSVENNEVKNVVECDQKILEIYDKYHQHYCNIRQQLKTNNDFIYGFIRKRMDGHYITNVSYGWWKYHFEHVLLNKVTYNLETKKELYFDIIERIMKSYYNRNYFGIKNKLLNHEPINMINEDFVEQVKNGEYLFGRIEQLKWKDRILKLLVQRHGENIYKRMPGNKLRTTMLTDRAILKHFVMDHLGENKSKLTNDVTGNIITKAYQAYSSYFAVRAKGLKCNRPKFLPKNGLFNILYSGDTRNGMTDDQKGHIRITLGNYVGEHYNEIIKSYDVLPLQKGRPGRYLDVSEFKKIQPGQRVTKKDHLIWETGDYIKKNNPYIFHANYLTINIPSKLRDQETNRITQVEFVPLYDGYQFKICYTYRYEPIVFPENERKIQYNDCVSIDLGVNNLLTIHDPTGRQRLISGGYINSTNYHYNHRIDTLKSATKICQGKDTSPRIRDTWIKRENVINSYFNNLVSWFVRSYAHKRMVIVGYNKGWKTNASMGRANNRKFYNIPYSKLLNKLRFQLKNNGIEMVETEESYTSKCDALALESIEKHEQYLGERYGRYNRLFRSSTGKVVHADLNGSINIMRKYFTKIGNPIMEIEGKQIRNPLRTVISRMTGGH